MKLLLQFILVLFSISLLQAKDEEITGTYVSMFKGEGITFITFKVNGKNRDFEGVEFDKSLFEKHKNEPILIRYKPKYAIIENAYFLDGTNVNNEKTVNAKYIKYKGKLDVIDYLIFEVNGRETIFHGYNIGANTIRKNKGKVYHIVYSEGLDGSKTIDSISLGIKPIVLKKPQMTVKKTKKIISLSNQNIIYNLKNATYTGITNYPITLINGEYESKKDYIYISFVKLLTQGDITSDGKIEYIVLLVSSGGGSGSFPSIAIMKEKNHTLNTIGTIDLGDRTQILSQKIQNQQLILKIKDHGPNDPACCPTRVRTHIWKFTSRGLQKIKGHRLGY